MNKIVRPGAGIVFMKVGVHPQEPLAEIIARKSAEIESAGFAMWGYGGNTCHPRTMVQPFADEFTKVGRPIYLCMEEMESSHWAEPVIAAQYSADGEVWKDIHPDIQVRGSRFAMIIRELHKDSFELPLSRTRVAAGLNRGRSGTRYVQGRVDKACLESPTNQNWPTLTKSLRTFR